MNHEIFFVLVFYKLSFRLLYKYTKNDNVSVYFSKGSFFKESKKNCEKKIVKTCDGHFIEEKRCDD